MYGAILGDMIGAPYEFDQGNKSKDFPMFIEQSQFTDDTVMTIAVAEALLDHKDDTLDAIRSAVIRSMQAWGHKYPAAGYGARFKRWLNLRSPDPYGSYGNGSAMRISPVGFAARDVEEAKYLAAEVTKISHNHPEGMKGAEATAVAIVMAREGKTKEEIREAMEQYYELNMTVEKYRKKQCGHGREICRISVPQALICFFEGDSYEDVIRNCISIGGDSDTIAAIAGGIAEAYYGVPDTIREKAEAYLDRQLLGIVKEFRKKYEI